jgi:hypothetical protein
VIDSASSLITAQVQSGLVVRMAILYELLAGHGPRGVREEPVAPEAVPETPPTIGQPA